MSPAGRREQMAPIHLPPAWTRAGLAIVAIVVSLLSLILLAAPWLPGRFVAFAMIAAAALILAGALVATRPRARRRIAAGEQHAREWLADAIAAWQADERITPAEAARLRADLSDPRLLAVLPHLGVHLTLELFLRFPVGSLARAGYTLGQMIRWTGLLLLRRASRETWRRAIEIHAPLVLALTCIPGFGAVAYLAAKPIRAHPLLGRIALDAALLALPGRLYERSGARGLIARPREPDATSAGHVEPRGVSIALGSRRWFRWLLLVAVALLALDLLVQSADVWLHPTIVAWPQFVRIVDLDSEASLGTWFQIVLLAACAAALAIIAVAKHRAADPFRRHWLVVALIVLGLSIDEQAKLHDPGGGIGDRARQTLGLSGVFYYGWVLVALASILVVAFAFRRFIRSLPVAIRARFFLAATLFIGGELGMEMINGWLLDPASRGLLYQTGTSIEEFLGTAGTLVALAALTRYLTSEIGAIRLLPAPRQSAPPPSPPVPAGYSRSVSQRSASARAIERT